MIDDKKEADELIEVLNEHLPMRAFATPELMKAVVDSVDDRAHPRFVVGSPHPHGGRNGAPSGCPRARGWAHGRAGLEDAGANP